MDPTPAASFASRSAAWSPRQLVQAPHRLMFFIGATNLLLAMAWWSAVLAGQRWPALALPQPPVPTGWVHAFVMQYQMLPSFMFGFLLTVFPRWMGLPELARWRYLPVGIGVFGGQFATLLGALAWPPGLVIGALMTLAGWLAALAALAPLLWRERGRTWHARACFGALCLGLVGLLAWLAFLLGASPLCALASIRIGGFGLLLPVYLSVAHRMFPFFAGNAVPGYQAWRPLWLLALALGLCLAHLVLALLDAERWLWLADAPLLLLTAWLCWRWWPRGPKPALLTVLFLGLAWLPVAFALYTLQSLGHALHDTAWLGRAPAHALFIGFFGSVLVAMVTRVTQGHSGGPLVMPAAARFAFAGIQLVALLRIAAEVLPDPQRWQLAAAFGWLLALAPWVARLARTYLSPRSDGKPG